MKLFVSIITIMSMLVIVNCGRKKTKLVEPNSPVVEDTLADPISDRAEYSLPADYETTYLDLRMPEEINDEHIVLSDTVKVGGGVILGATAICLLGGIKGCPDGVKFTQDKLTKFSDFISQVTALRIVKINREKTTRGAIVEVFRVGSQRTKEKINIAVDWLDGFWNQIASTPVFNNGVTSKLGQGIQSIWNRVTPKKT